jgi:hypothetical protein
MPGPSIKAPDGLTFGDTFQVTWEPANGPDKDYWARAECFATDATETHVALGAKVYEQSAHLEPAGGGVGIGIQSLTLGPTPSWSGGGATCKVSLRAYDSRRGTFGKALATDDFTVS